VDPEGGGHTAEGGGTDGRGREEAWHSEEERRARRASNPTFSPLSCCCKQLARRRNSPRRPTACSCGDGASRATKRRRRASERERRPLLRVLAEIARLGLRIEIPGDGWSPCSLRRAPGVRGETSSAAIVARSEFAAAARARMSRGLAERDGRPHIRRGVTPGVRYGGRRRRVRDHRNGAGSPAYERTERDGEGEGASESRRRGRATSHASRVRRRENARRRSRAEVDVRERERVHAR